MTTKFIKVQEHQPMGEYKETAIDEQKSRADILIKSCNGGSFTISAPHLIIEGRGVKWTYENGNKEVTESKLNQLRKKYVVQTDF